MYATDMAVPVLNNKIKNLKGGDIISENETIYPEREATVFTRG